MSGIVIVESSATLSHLLQRTLSAIKQDVERTLTTYAEASALLAEVEAGTVRFKVMVIGAPARHGAEFEALLQQLGEGRAPSLAILILSHEKTPFLSEWLARRRNAFLLLWSNFGRIPAALKELMPPDTGTPEAQPAAAETARAPPPR